MTDADYSPPVDQLLTYGRVHPQREWPNYVEELQLDASHIPELLRMGLDPALSNADTHSKEVWAPLHAWRALGQLRAIETLDRLIKLVDTLNDDWLPEEMSQIISLMGPASLPHLQTALANTDLEDITRCQVSECVAELGQTYPEHRDDCVAALTQQLQYDKANGPEINAFLIAALLDLKAVEAEPLMQKVFLARRVEEMIVGSWAEVQKELGIQSEVEIPAAPRRPLGQMFSPLPPTHPVGFGSPTPGSKAAGKGKRKKK